MRTALDALYDKITAEVGDFLIGSQGTIQNARLKALEFEHGHAEGTWGRNQWRRVYDYLMERTLRE